MSSANSPSIAGKLGASFLRKLCKRYPELQGTPVSNTWEKQFTYRAHDPSVLAFAHVVDCFLHAYLGEARYWLESLHGPCGRDRNVVQPCQSCAAIPQVMKLCEKEFRNNRLI